jgi:hypothetical protein
VSGKNQVIPSIYEFILNRGCNLEKLAYNICDGNKLPRIEVFGEIPSVLSESQRSSMGKRGEWILSGSGVTRLGYRYR